jgi:hypothetical protein
LHKDIADTRCAFLLNYPATASWAAYPNTKNTFFKTVVVKRLKPPFDKICQKEPWKNLAVLGDALPGIVISPVQTLLIDYWRAHLGFKYSNLEMIDCSTYLDELSQGDRIDKVITLFHLIISNLNHMLLIQILTTTCSAKQR